MDEFYNRKAIPRHLTFPCDKLMSRNKENLFLY